MHTPTTQQVLMTHVSHLLHCLLQLQKLYSPRYHIAFCRYMSAQGHTAQWEPALG